MITAIPPITPAPVTFPTAQPWVLRDMAAPRLRRLTGRGHLYRPASLAGGQRAPAVVIMEGLGGLKAHRELAYGAWLASQGFIALVVDSFGPRGMGEGPDDASHNLRALRVTESAMLADAFAALRLLAEQPDVSAEAIAVMGFSYGGMITTLAAYDQIARTFAPDGLRFAAHAAYYGCSVPRLDDATATGAPVALWLGELDDNVSVERSRCIADDLRRGGAPVTLTVHPGVHHQWDGDDVTLRHVSYALGDLRMTVLPDNRIRDDLTGITVRGPVSRAAAILAGVKRRGYHVLRDVAATDRTNQDTLALFRGMTAADRAAG